MSTFESEYGRYLILLKKNIRLFIISSLAIMTFIVMISYLLPKKYEAKSTVFIEKNVINDLVKGIAVTPSVDDSVKVLTYALNSRTLITKVINEVDFNLKTKSDAEIEQLIKYLQKNTEIKVSDKDLFLISFRHSNPRVARDYVNTLVRSYIEQNISSKREESYGASKFLQGQIETYKERMDKIEAVLNQQKSGKGTMANLDEGALMREIGTAQQKLYDLQLKRRQLEEEKVHASNPLHIKLLGLKKRLEELRSQYTDNYPEVINVQSQIVEVQQEMKSRPAAATGGTETPETWKLDSELKAIRENEQLLQRYIDENKKVLRSIPTAKASLEKLEAEKANQKNMYDLLFLRQSQSEVSKQIELQDKSTTFRIVDPAVTPVYPVSPNRKKLILLGILAGFAGGMGILSLFDYFDSSIKMVDSLQPIGIPVLAVIPLIRSEQEINAEKREKIHLYIASCSYFALILAILVMEVLGITLMDTLMSKIYVPEIVTQFFNQF